MGRRRLSRIPILSQDGHAIGTMCVIDAKPRKWRPEELETLAILARAVTAAAPLPGLDVAARYLPASGVATDTALDGCGWRRGGGQRQRCGVVAGARSGRNP